MLLNYAKIHYLQVLSKGCIYNITKTSKGTNLKYSLNA